MNLMKTKTMSCNCEENKKYELDQRRSFLTKLILSIGGFISAVLAFPLVTAMLDPVTRKKREVWRAVGRLDEFEVGETRMVTFKNASPYSWSEKIANSAAYVRRGEDDSFLALSVNCTHLGCPVRWEEKSKLFMCPCHGGVYYKDGSRAAGPPPRGMFHYEIRVSDNQVEIRTESIPITNLIS